MNKTNYTKLGITIFAAVLTANIISAVLITNWLSYQASQALIKATEDAKITSEQAKKDFELRMYNLSIKNKNIAKEQLKYAAKQKADRERIAAERKREHANKLGVQTTNRQTCSFWQRTYAAEKTEKSRAYRDDACARAGIRYP